jgi:hypothetical protein
MSHNQPTVFFAECMTLMARRVMVSLLLLAIGSLLLLSGCGGNASQEAPRSRTYTIAIDNQSSQPVKLRFDAVANGQCEKGHVKDTIPSASSRVISVAFLGCTSGGGSKIATVVYEFLSQGAPETAVRESVSGSIIDGSKIICLDGSCKVFGQ